MVAQLALGADDAQKSVFIGTTLHCTIASGVFAHRHPCTGALSLDTVNHKMHKIWSVDTQENY